MNSVGEDRGTIIYDAEDGFIKSLEDLASESITDEKEERPNIKNDSETLPQAPDGGYGWVICCGVFLNHMIYGGLGRSEGLFYLQFKSKFETSAQLAAWPGSLLSTVNLLMGPLCGIVVSRYSSRTAYIIGTCLCFIGFLLNAFTPSIYFLFVSHTLFGGIGRGLMSGILLLNLYFDKHRSLATGLSSSGVGIGTLWFVPLTQFLFDEYGFTGAFLILSAISLHGLCVAMIFRPLRTHYRYLTAKRLKKYAKKSENKEDYSTSFTNVSNRKLESIKEQDQETVEMSIIEENMQETEKQTPEEIETLLKEQPIHSEDKNSNTPVPVDQSAEKSHDSSPISEQGASPLLESKVDENTASSKSKYKEESCLRSSLKICFPTEFKRNSETTKMKTFHWELFKHVPFIVFCMGNLFFYLAFKTAFIFLPAIAMSKGLTKTEATLLLTVSGAMDTFGRIAIGLVMDIRVMRPFRPYFFNLTIFIVALASIVMPSLTTFATFCIVCAIYGCTTGAMVAQKMVVLVDILGREKMPSSLGIQKVFQGIGTLIGPPLAGALRDALGNYDSSFYLGGASMIGAGLMLSLSSLLLKIRNRKSQI